MVLLLLGCENDKLNYSYVPEDFKYDVQLRMTPVKNQGRSELCWVYSMFAVLESEYLESGGDTLNLSVDYIGRRYLEELVREYYRSKETSRMSLRGVGAMTLELVNRYGTLPEEVYHPSEPVDYYALTEDVVTLTHSALEKGKTEDELMARLGQYLDTLFGVVPDTFSYRGKDYTPYTFAQYVIGDRQYETLTSKKNLDWNKRVDPQLTDNRLGCKALNIKGDKLVECVAHSLKCGNAVMWEGGPNDNHAVAIFGMGHDKHGTRYFVAKNSWGTNNPTHGLFYIEEKYLEKHTALVVKTK